jgi:hypothetical protein
MQDRDRNQMASTLSPSRLRKTGALNLDIFTTSQHLHGSAFRHDFARSLAAINSDPWPLAAGAKVDVRWRARMMRLVEERQTYEACERTGRLDGR